MADRHGRPGAAPERVRAYLAEVLHTFPFTPPAADYLRHKITLEIGDLNTTQGGGFWYPEQKRVYLFTAQYEAAIHEFAHAWWQPLRPAHKLDLIQAVLQSLRDTDPRYARARELSTQYVYGIPEQNFRGFFVPGEEIMDWELYAGHASGCMADIRKLPPTLRAQFSSLFRLLPQDAPAPLDLAAHR